MLGKNDKKSVEHVKIKAIRITLIYLVVGCLWIIFTDNIVEKIFTNPSDIIMINIAKGLFYVITTAVLIFFLIYSSFIKLKQNEERLRRSQEISKAGTWELEMESSMIWASDQTLNLFGLKTKTNILNINDVENMIHEDDRQIAHDAIINLIEDNKKYDIEYRIQPFGAGDFRYVRSIAEKQLDDKGNIVKIVGVILDMTEKRKLEQEKALLQEQVWNHQKLESIGTLASGVAHEINNPINGILNYGQIILDSTETDSQINKYAGEIIYETNRVSEIVKNLLNFSKQSGKQHSYAQIDDIIGKTLSLVSTIFRHDDINLSVDIKENISNLKCRSQQIQQVLMNLLTNSRDALNEKYPGYHENKKINLECHEFSMDNKKWISLSIEDSGTGIPEEIKHRIFDPFFTTKDKEKGTGLGLSISYGIIKEHHGEIQVDSKEGEYTKFTLLLPCENGWDINDK
ncbi:MAG: PAS domain-containing protein [Clostridia bacterium]|nr:PAS domain-containing protein [Clostridia bacterium]